MYTTLVRKRIAPTFMSGVPVMSCLTVMRESFQKKVVEHTDVGFPVTAISSITGFLVKKEESKTHTGTGKQAGARAVVASCELQVEPAPVGARLVWQWFSRFQTTSADCAKCEPGKKKAQIKKGGNQHRKASDPFKDGAL